MNNAQGVKSGNESSSFRALHATLVARITRVLDQENDWYGSPIGAEVVTEVAIKRVLMSLHSSGSPLTVPLRKFAYLLGKDIAKKSSEALDTLSSLVVPAWWTDETAAARWTDEMAMAWWIDAEAESRVWEWTGETAESAAHCRRIGHSLMILLIRSSDLIVVELDPKARCPVVSLHPEWAKRLPQYEARCPVVSLHPA